ncbi:MerR family transcriptional regulator [Streptomyces sp. NPDC057638]|uniref:helix-turn-helix domain-containing protein n=1 Tax=Streptomyces sp. NPDC057638 TaxID=3346190 RepID=UPI0036BE5776
MRRGVLIGEAAALFGLAPSTVRWWERRGVLDPPAREGGRRVYGEADLRRLGLAYLCCVVGRMPLDQAAVVTSGRASLDTWRDAIGAQMGVLERRVGELEAALAYLRHLRRCEDDDIVRCCPVLESELSARTPRGRVPGGDLVGAARAAGRGGPVGGDEIRVEGAPGDVLPVGCPGCRGPVVSGPRGRRRTYCSQACRQRVYRARRGGAAAPSGAGTG